jgi:hypothetical protein
MTVLATAPDVITHIKFDFDPNDKAKTNDSNIAQRGTVSDILSSVTDGTYTIGTGSCIAGQGSTGTIATGSGSLNPIVTKTPVLPVAADYNTTIVIAAAGGLLTILGILGLAFL